MAIYVTDPWDSLSPGFSGPPPTWFLFGTSTVVASDGAFPGHNYGAGFYNPLSTPIFHDVTPTTADIKVQGMFGAKVDPSFRFTVSAKDVSGNPAEVFRIQRDNDGALVMFSGTGGTTPLLIASPPPPFNPNVAASSGIYGVYFFEQVWYYFTIQVEITAGTGVDAGKLLVSASLNVDGQTVIPTAAVASIPLSNFPGGGSVLNSEIVQCSWFGNTGFNTQVQISDWGDPLPDITTPFDRISQMTNEVATEPTESLVRVSQMVDELEILPVHSKVRITQMVIELMTPFVPPSARGLPFWNDAELMNVGSLSWTDFDF